MAFQCRQNSSLIHSCRPIPLLSELLYWMRPLLSHILKLKVYIQRFPESFPTTLLSTNTWWRCFTRGNPNQIMVWGGSCSSFLRSVTWHPKDSWAEGWTLNSAGRKEGSNTHPTSADERGRARAERCAQRSKPVAAAVEESGVPARLQENWASASNGLGSDTFHLFHKRMADFPRRFVRRRWWRISAAAHFTATARLPTTLESETTESTAHSLRYRCDSPCGVMVSAWLRCSSSASAPCFISWTEDPLKFCWTSDSISVRTFSFPLLAEARHHQRDSCEHTLHCTSRSPALISVQKSVSTIKKGILEARTSRSPRGKRLFHEMNRRWQRLLSEPVHLTADRLDVLSSCMICAPLCGVSGGLFRLFGLWGENHFNLPQNFIFPPPPPPSQVHLIESNNLRNALSFAPFEFNISSDLPGRDCDLFW